jgi:predicted Rossmann-fold nucleotide-binding protein
MSVRQVVENYIKNTPPQNIIVSNKMQLQTEMETEKLRHEWTQARKHALLQRLTRSYGIAIFGSARLEETTYEFHFVRNLAKTLVMQRQIDIVTGGGPGIMLAAHKGAKEAISIASEDGRTFKAKTFGVNIELPHEQLKNGLADIYTIHIEFSTRLQELIDKTQGVYIAPGGYGTLLELAMVLQLKQVGHLSSDYPILVHPFWKPMFDVINNKMYDERVASHHIPFIDREDLPLLTFTEDIVQIASLFIEGYDKWYEVFKKRRKNQNQIQTTPIKQKFAFMLKHAK